MSSNTGDHVNGQIGDQAREAQGYEILCKFLLEAKGEYRTSLDTQIIRALCIFLIPLSIVAHLWAGAVVGFLAVLTIEHIEVRRRDALAVRAFLKSKGIEIDLSGHRQDALKSITKDMPWWVIGVIAAILLMLIRKW